MNFRGGFYMDQEAHKGVPRLLGSSHRYSIILLEWLMKDPNIEQWCSKEQVSASKTRAGKGKTRPRLGLSCPRFGS